MNTNDKIRLIREEMMQSKIDAYIIPSNDPHNSEYLPDYYKTRQWVSGFTGSAGTLVITQEESGLWTDGRYFLQAEDELKGSEIELYKMRMPNVPTIHEWLNLKLPSGSTIGFNGFQYSAHDAEMIKSELKDKKIKLDFRTNIVDKIWLNRPYLPTEKVFIHDEVYAGESAKRKIEHIRANMVKNECDYHLINKLDDIAWLLNLRGSDIKNNPYFLSYVLIDKEITYLYIDILKLNDKIINYLHENDIKVKIYEDVLYDLQDLEEGKRIVLDKKAIPYQLYHDIDRRCQILDQPNHSTTLKAIKNEIECSHLRDCHIQDGVAMLRFMKWLDETVPTGNITETIADEELTQYRSEISTFFSRSFDTIAGYKDHAALMHYKAKPETEYTLKPESLFLVDSGGQYLNGTTDITRTFALGPLSDEEKRDYTLVLKSMIQLSKAIFLEGTTGTNLDILARKPMWDNGLDYKCGTGHGVGFFMGVHEGPQGISMVYNTIPLESGMILTNEPGIYKSDRHGIRIENTLLTVPFKTTEFGKFYHFETLTMTPIDMRPVVKALLTDEEIEWINQYHQTVHDALRPHLSKEDAAYLEKVTQAI
ncbi:aminopeptidase P family protein [Fusibacter ferrireducens]|uniref:Aminopeptidase P family protein n=1 Tax=Fusibacter ferrireducens TaxID=2785058 RepID=A0ABR9ZVW2_9FIRM|nr:aminopeptidase P family protein [Fusibacter ferrireducens]MBF4694603.1 aminopeptidase P family protein [Fusibacter ferrireducens]